MLELKEIYFHPATSQKPILKKISLKANYGHPTIIQGSSGSGKTSLIEVISGLSRPQKGLIEWQGKSLNLRQRKSLCGVIFQFPERHFLGLTVTHELRLGHLRLSGEDQYKVLSKVGLSEIKMTQPPERLSGGQQRRLAIAVQLLKKPKILLLDEPTAGLDWSVRDEVIELIKELSKERLIIVVTHEPELFKNLSIDSYHLHYGELKLMSKLPLVE
tara:strand:+ start:12549 stop:13196 length:648 start_codon:yes stop_codon:yes gene_type:complete